MPRRFSGRLKKQAPGHECWGLTWTANAPALRAARKPVSCLTCSFETQILPTRSKEGLSVFAPSCHLAGHTSPG